jgi:tetratricopeptide (TPR) repeat protein
MDAMGRFDEGLALKRKALDGLRSVFGPNHPTVLATSNNIAYTLHTRGRYSEAEAIYREVVAGLEKVLGPEHPGVADPLNNLGKVLMDQGRFTEAAPFVRRAAAIRGRTDDLDHVSRITTEMNLGSLELALGQVDEAVALYRSGLDRFEALAGPDSPPAVRCRALLGIALHRAGQPAEAIQLLRSVIAQQRANGRRLDLADSLSGLGAALSDLGQPAQALPLLEEALDIRQASLAADHWSIAEVRIELGRTLQQLGRDTEGARHLAAGRAALDGQSGHQWALGRAQGISSSG